MEPSSEKVKISTCLIRAFLSNVIEKGVSTINKHKLVLLLSVAVGIVISITTIIIIYNYFKFSDISVLSSSSGQQQNTAEVVTAEPSLVGQGKNTLKIENFVAPRSLSSPTSMAFIYASNLLVLQKDGQVRLVSNGILQKKPVLIVPVDNVSVDYWESQY